VPNLDIPMPRLPYTHHRVVTDDGIDLAVQTVGEGPAVVLGNGIGVSKPGLDILADHLRDRYRVICWDYRGVGESWLPDKDVSFTMQRHAADALQILDALGEERAAVLGWSMGVPVGLEMIRHAPERIAGYGALFGASGQPFRAAFGRLLAEVVHLGVRTSTVNPWPAQAVLSLGAALPPVAWALCSAVRFVGPWAHADTFPADVRSTAGADKTAYFNTMYELINHDGSDLLPSIGCPTLVVAGEQDWITPPATAEKMARATPGCELVVLPRTTHFGIIEHGPDLWDPVDRMLEKAFV
jgi:pimeloyl-ACP methyl ester carboxylesterase